MYRACAVALLVCLLGSCSQKKGPGGLIIDSLQPTPSPSGDHTLQITKEPSSTDRNARVWVILIKDASGAVEYRLKSDFDGDYWIHLFWDSEDRAWVYNPVDTRWWYWELSKGTWVKHPWDNRNASLPRPPIDYEFKLRKRKT